MRRRRAGWLNDCFNSIKAYKKLFPYMTVWQIRQGLKILIDAGVVVTENYNRKKYDRTIWYAFRNEETALEGLPDQLRDSQKEMSDSTNQACKSHKPIPIPKPYRLPDENNNNEISSEERLGLDLEIAEANRFFTEQVSLALRPRGREVTTFANIARYLVRESQGNRLPVSIFKDAVEWAKQAAASTATNKKGLFVQKVKEKTGFRKQKKLLERTSGIRDSSRKSIQEQKRLLGVV